MDYPSFFKRDYNLAPLGSRSSRRLRHLPWISALALAIGATALLGVMTDKAEAFRAAAIDPDPDQDTREATAQRVLSLTLPGRVERREADTAEAAPVPRALEPPTVAEPPSTDQSQTRATAGEAGSETPEEPAPGDWHTITVKRGDTLAKIFARLDIDPAELHQIMQLGQPVRSLERIRPGQRLRLNVGDDGELRRLVHVLGELRRLRVTRTDDGFDAGIIEREPELRLSYAVAEIDSSLFLAAREAGLSTRMTMELARIFGWDIDFALDIRNGDRFTVLYEERYLDGEKIGDGRILAAEFLNRGDTHRAIYFEDADGGTDYYAPNGHNMRKEFLRTPVEFTRISSRFSRGRHHPILNRIRAHNGVDYAAPNGTPIRATGDGKVVHAGRNGGYGKMVVLKHGVRYSTAYAHMSRFARGIRSGRRVEQGDIIGYVGSTGLATGPHLHYEFRVNGTHRNPLRVELPEAEPLPDRYRDEFQAVVAHRIAQLETIKRTQLALNDQ